jgi:DUF1009 family protein
LLQLSNTQFADIRTEAKEFSIQAINNDQFSGIGSYLARESMANVIVIGTLNKPNAKVDDLLFLLMDHDYEVRLLVLQKLLDHFGSSTEYAAECLPG